MINGLNVTLNCEQPWVSRFGRNFIVFDHESYQSDEDVGEMFLGDDTMLACV